MEKSVSMLACRPRLWVDPEDTESSRFGSNTGEMYRMVRTLARKRLEE